MTEARRPLPCPRCRTRAYTPYGVPWTRGMPARPAVSDTDGSTLICSECGNTEWWGEFFGVDLEPQEKWPIT